MVYHSFFTKEFAVTSMSIRACEISVAEEHVPDKFGSKYVLDPWLSRSHVWEKSLCLVTKRWLGHLLSREPKDSK